VGGQKLPKLENFVDSKAAFYSNKLSWSLETTADEMEIFWVIFPLESFGN